MRTLDMIEDLVTDLHGRRGRTLLLVAAVALSTGTMLASLGLSQTASAQVANDVAGSITNEVTVTVGSQPLDPAFGPNTVENVGALAMVEAVGLRIDVDADRVRLRRLGVSVPRSASHLIGMTSGYAHLHGIELPTVWMLDAADRVALLGPQAADALGVPRSGLHWSGYSIEIGGKSYSVIGILSANDSETSQAVIIPYSLAVEQMRSDTSASLVVRTRAGAGARVAEVVRASVNPVTPNAYKVTRVADLANVRRGVETQLASLVAAVGAMLLILTILLLANTMVANVVGRTAEIGLRRALGMSTGEILGLFLSEGALIGLLGGLGGTAVGLWTTNIVSIVNDWSPVLSPLVLALGPVTGAIIGVVASAQPATKAARVSPATAVRMD